MDGATPESADRSRLRSVAPGLLAALLGALVFLGALWNGFAYDDAFILRSPLLEHPWSLTRIFSGEFYAPSERYLGLYRPLGQWSLVVNAAFAEALAGGVDRPAIYHAVNVLLHAAASFLVFAWLSRLPISRWVAGAAAILWAVHPVHAEVAVNITARYESASAVLGFLFLIAHRSGRGILSGLLLLGALLCKESAIVFLPLALAVSALFPKDGRRFDLPAFVPAAVVLGLWLVLRAVALSGDETARPFVENPLAAASLFERIPTAAKVQLLYLRDQLLPLRLSTDHSYDQIPIERSFLGAAFLGFLALAAAAGFAAWRLSARRPEIALAIVGYAIAFSIGCNFLVPIGTIMADRLAYVPSVFTCLLAAIVLSYLPRAAGVALVAVLAGLLGWASVRQVPQWKDDLTLFRRQVVTAPRSAKAHGNLGNALREKGRLADAIEEYKRSIEIFPFRPEPHVGLAQAYEFEGARPELLIHTWADAVRYGTSGDEPLLQELLTNVDLGRWTEIEHIRHRMIDANPNDPFLVHVGRILDAARRLVAEPLVLDESVRGRVLLRQRDFAGAEKLFQKALYQGSVYVGEIPQVLRDLAQCHEQQGRPMRAHHFKVLAAKVAAEKPEQTRRAE